MSSKLSEVLHKNAHALVVARALYIIKAAHNFG